MKPTKTKDEDSPSVTGAPRPVVIEALVQGALRGMLSAVDECTGSEVLSAYFTLLKQGIHASLKVSPGPLMRSALLLSLTTLMLDCADPEMPH